MSLIDYIAILVGVNVKGFASALPTHYPITGTRCDGFYVSIFNLANFACLTRLPFPLIPLLLITSGQKTASLWIPLPPCQKWSHTSMHTRGFGEEEKIKCIPICCIRRTKPSHYIGKNPTEMKS